MPNIRKSTREIILKRDNYTCHLCGGVINIDAPPNSPLQHSLDHIKPVSLGGTNHRDNLRSAHRECNSLRGNNISRLDPDWEKSKNHILACLEYALDDQEYPAAANLMEALYSLYRMYKNAWS